MTIPNNTTIIQALYAQAPGTVSSNPFITVYSLRNPTQFDINYPIQKRWVNFTSPASEWILESFSNNTGQTLANWILLSSGGFAAVENVQVDLAIAPGVNPVSPLANIIDFGQSFATHNPISTGTTAAAYRSVTRALHEYGIELQLAGSNAATSTPNNFGISQFDANQFDVTAGFVQLKGNGVNPALTKVAVQTGLSPVVPDATGQITFNGATVLAGTNPVRTDGTGANTMALEVQISQAIAATDATKIGLSNFDSAQFTVDAGGFVQLKGGTTPAILTISDDVNTKVQPDGTGNIQLVGHVVNQTGNFSTTVSNAVSHLINVNPMSPARWIVDSLGFNGTHTTIQSAINSATSGDTIFIVDGTYTENLTLKAGVSLTSWGSNGSFDASGHVIINGKCTFTGTGTVNMFGIQLQTNGDFLLAVTGSSASNVNLNNCYINCTNNTGINFSSSNAQAKIQLKNCSGNLATTGIGYWTNTSAGYLAIYSCELNNSGSSITSSTSNSTGTIDIQNSFISAPISTSTSSTFISARNANFLCDFINVTSVTLAGTGTSNFERCEFNSGTATGLSIGAGTTAKCTFCSVASSNTNAIGGSGTLTYSPFAFTGSSGNVQSTLTQTNFQYGPIIALEGGACTLRAILGDPTGVVTATQGSLCLRSDGATNTTRAFINTNGTTGWTGINTVA